MTEIRMKIIEFKKRGKMFCAVDNHNKKGKDTEYKVIYAAKTKIELISYMNEKVYQP